MNKTSYATQDHILPPGGSILISRSGNFAICLEASASFKVRFDQNPRSDWEQGIKFKFEFQTIEVLNESDTPLSFKLGIGSGDIEDARTTFNGAIQTISTVPDVFRTQPAVNVKPNGVLTILHENLLRREAIIVNMGADRVYISGSGASGNKIGIPLEPYSTLILNTTADIHAYNPTVPDGPDFGQFDAVLSVSETELTP